MWKENNGHLTYVKSNRVQNDMQKLVDSETVCAIVQSWFESVEFTLKGQPQHPLKDASLECDE